MTDDRAGSAPARLIPRTGEAASPPPIFAQAPQFRPLRSDAYEALREAILLGHLRAGERVVEAEIARQMGISRGPIREAVRQLEQDGLVEYQPRRGVVVAPLSRDTVRDAYGVRAELDGYAARIAVANITDHHIARLIEIIDTMRGHARADDAEGLLHADVAFHQHIYTVAGNRVLLRLWTSLGPQAWTLFSGAQLRGYSLIDLADLHPPIVDALRTGDAAIAERAAKEHTQYIARGVLNHLDELALAVASEALPVIRT
ncbi:MAG: GntR family transcriptional regulator [Chloroflexota bacterium]